eukprot:GSA25T00021323001.1
MKKTSNYILDPLVDTDDDNFFVGRRESCRHLQQGQTSKERRKPSSSPSRTLKPHPLEPQ